jgi:hypothetical protein
VCLSQFLGKLRGPYADMTQQSRHWKYMTWGLGARKAEEKVGGTIHRAIMGHFIRSKRHWTCTKAGGRVGEHHKQWLDMGGVMRMYGRSVLLRMA